MLTLPGQLYDKQEVLSSSMSCILLILTHLKGVVSNDYFDTTPFSVRKSPPQRVILPGGAVLDWTMKFLVLSIVFCFLSVAFNAILAFHRTGT